MLIPPSPISPHTPQSLFLIITFGAFISLDAVCVRSELNFPLKSWSCFSTAFLNFLCILYLSTSSILSPRSSRKLWENMAIQAFNCLNLVS
ncbi:hypothetical protein GLYMA_17G111800v4 [Glycine max]|uniref:Uncharacterized protein n=1 Tax=Glycine max TaxID=3847 RepID=K7ML40_SOYBN|nr:hypothetical protein JHK87_046899 [Glycine soja]KAG4943024.1 hypothetical protein JHK85_047670 [Glycine max]KAG5102135.1 hypothetical protein JHK84_047104 [Glycine max]KAH1117951.1 hypothetical protein GYH30_046950 [Glycine max]KRH03662.1 hypothetical protein GLYMA_17G111800v4 [Glycine max]